MKLSIRENLNKITIGTEGKKNEVKGEKKSNRTSLRVPKSGPHTTAGIKKGRWWRKGKVS